MYFFTKMYLNLIMYLIQQQLVVPINDNIETYQTVVDKLLNAVVYDIKSSSLNNETHSALIL